MSIGIVLAGLMLAMSLLGQHWLSSNAEKLLEAVRRNQIRGESPQRAIARAYSLEKTGQRLFWLGLMLAAGCYLLLR